MRQLGILGAAALSLAIFACGEDKTTTPPQQQGFPQPAGTVAVNFIVDDTANKVFGAGELKWKGSMLYDSTTRKITYDGTWSGGGTLQWATLYDDGPWNVDPPGHEPAGSVAGDHKWGVTVFVTPPATGSQPYEYGLINVPYEQQYGNGWIWIGSNGSFTVNAGMTTPINATGMTLPAFGTIDMQLTLDTNNLDPGGTWSTATVDVKGSAWAWGEVSLLDDGTKGDAAAGDGIYTFELSEYVGAGKQFHLSGLLLSGDKPEFVWVLNGVEYKVSGAASTVGAGAGTRTPPATNFTPATIQIAGNNNTYITIP